MIDEPAVPPKAIIDIWNSRNDFLAELKLCGFAASPGSNFTKYLCLSPCLSDCANAFSCDDEVDLFGPSESIGWWPSGLHVNWPLILMIGTANEAEKVYYNWRCSLKSNISYSSCTTAH